MVYARSDSDTHHTVALQNFFMAHFFFFHPGSVRRYLITRATTPRVQVEEA